MSESAAREARYACVLRSLNRFKISFAFRGRRPQKVEGVRKLVTRRYPYLAYYRLDEEAGEIVILTIQHPAQEREHSDV